MLDYSKYITIDTLERVKNNGWIGKDVDCDAVALYGSCLNIPKGEIFNCIPYLESKGYVVLNHYPGTGSSLITLNYKN